jgi:hypothetical protein
VIAGPPGHTDSGHGFGWFIHGKQEQSSPWCSHCEQVLEQRPHCQPVIHPHSSVIGVPDLAPQLFVASLHGFVVQEQSSPDVSQLEQVFGQLPHSKPVTQPH